MAKTEPITVDTVVYVYHTPQSIKENVTFTLFFQFLSFIMYFFFFYY